MERDNRDHNGVLRAFRSSGMLATVPTSLGLVEATGLSEHEPGTPASTLAKLRYGWAPRGGRSSGILGGGRAGFGGGARFMEVARGMT